MTKCKAKQVVDWKAKYEALAAAVISVMGQVERTVKRAADSPDELVRQLPTPNALLLVEASAVMALTIYERMVKELGQHLPKEDERG